MKIVLYSIHLVIQSYLAFSNVPVSSGWQAGILGHRCKLLSARRAHCTELHKRLSREFSRWAMCYWYSRKRSVQSSSPCTLPKLVKVRRPTQQDATGTRPLHFMASGIRLADSWLKALCTSVVLCSLLRCWKLTVRLNYFQQGSKHTSLAAASPWPAHGRLNHFQTWMKISTKSSTSWDQVMACLSRIQSACSKCLTLKLQHFLLSLLPIKAKSSSCSCFFLKVTQMRYRHG